MLSSSSVLAVAIAVGAANAFTPPGFEPASSNNLTVAFGNTLALNGFNIAKAAVASAPIIGTTQQLSGTYTVMMVDPDIPPAVAGGATSELLHWLQPGLVSANTTSTIGGQTFFALVNPTNTSAFATYISPNPPNKSPTTHRYTQLLLNTTGNSNALSSLASAGANRSNFDAVSVVSNAGLTVLFGNSFNVSAPTNGTATTSSAAAGGTGAASTGSAQAGVSSSTTTIGTTTVAGATATGTGTGSSASASASLQSTGGVAGQRRGSGAVLAGLGAMAAAVVIL